VIVPAEIFTSDCGEGYGGGYRSRRHELAHFSS
jgi:hypothetical protein